MSELSTSKTRFSSPLVSDLIFLFSFILSHPIYFSYFIFFSPYLLKLVSFLSPLFIPTFLVLLAFLTELGGYTSVLEKLRSKQECRDDEFESLEDLGMYEILFGSSLMEFRESPVEFLEEKAEEDHFQDLGSDQENLSIGKEEKSPDSEPKVEKNTCAGTDERRLENFLKILDEFEKMASNAAEKPKVEKIGKVVEKPTMGSLMRNGSEANGNKITPAAKVSVNSSNDGKEQIPIVKAHSQRICSNDDDKDDREGTLKVESSRTLDQNYNLGTYGSMRKEKEWKRTLACKLFEERHNVDGGEGMDSLWEAYEMDSNKGKIQNNEKMKKNKKKVKVEEEEEEISGQLCCLQALKLSTGKMNLGMGRPNLVKISKAIKGIGWLHNVSKHSKKVHNNGDRY